MSTSNLLTAINARIPDNPSSQIKPADVRFVLEAMVNEQPYYQVLTLTQLINIQGNFEPGRLYLVRGAVQHPYNGVLSTWDALVRALSELELEPHGYLVTTISMSTEDDPDPHYYAARLSLRTRFANTNSADFLDTVLHPAYPLRFVGDGDYENPSGTFALDLSQAQRGRVVRLLLNGSTAAPTLPASCKVKGAHLSGVENVYYFRYVNPARVEVTITQFNG